MDFKPEKELKRKIKIRQAKIEDIPEIILVEKGAWGEKRAATKEMFESRIKTFPEGTIIAEIDNKIVGVLVSEIVDYDPRENSYSWYEITDSGFIQKTHNPKGDTIYGVDLSVSPDYQNLGVGSKLLETIAKLAIKYNVKRGMLGGRIMEYHKYSNKMSPEEYIRCIEESIKTKKEILPIDPEVYFYRKVGLEIIKVIPNYFDDPESLNYGILLLWNNPFYKKWYRWIMASLFRV